MPRPYPQEFRVRAVALVRAGKQAKQTAAELGIHPVTLSNWIRQDDIDNGRRPGLPGPTRTKRLRGVVTADDLVNRKFARPRPNELWVTDITRHRTREGWVYCAAVLDAYSRRIIGWSIDSKQDTTLVINALDMSIRNRPPEPGAIVHADHGTQFTSWLFGEKIRSAGLLPSFGSVGDGLDNAMMESFHNRQRRHSALGYRTPIEYETLKINNIPAAS